MALNFGSATPSAYYLGSNTVTTIYFGDTQVWPVNVFGTEKIYIDPSSSLSYTWPTASNGQTTIFNISPNTTSSVGMTIEAMRYSITSSTIIVQDPYLPTGRVIKYGNYRFAGNSDSNFLYENSAGTSFGSYSSIFTGSTWSYEIWVKPYLKTGSINGMTTKGCSPIFGSPSYFTLAIGNPDANDGSLYLWNRPNNSGNITQSAVTSQNVVTYNDWNHIIMTVQGQGSTILLSNPTASINLYVNGQQVAINSGSLSHPMGAVFKYNNQYLGFRVGKGLVTTGSTATPATHWGLMDTSIIRMYNKVLTANDVLDLYDNTKARYIPPALTSMKVLMPMDEFFGPANVTSVVTQYFTDAGYPTPTLDISNLTGSNYTGADLDPNVYQAVYIQNTAPGQVGNDPLLANNLKTYIENGGGVLFGPYIGAGDTYNPGGSAFDENLLPYNTKNTTLAGGGFLRHITVNNQHPIISASAIVSGDSIGERTQVISYTSANVRPAATLIASFSGSSNITYLAAQTYSGSGRVVHFNYSLLTANPGLAAIANKKLFANSLRWAANVI